MKKIIILLAIIIVIGFSVGFVLYSYPSQLNRIMKRMPMETSDPKVIFNGKGEYECKVTIAGIPEEYTNSTKIYVKKGMARFEEKFPSGDLEPLGLSVSVSKNGYIYSWAPQNVTTKEKIKPNEGMYAFISGDTDIKDQLKLNCHWSTIPDKMFEARGNEIFDKFAEHLLAEEWSMKTDVRRGYSFSFPVEIIISTTSDPLFDDYAMSGIIQSEEGLQNYNFYTNARHKKEVKPLEPESKMVLTTTIDEVYKIAIDVENSKDFAPESNLDSDYKVLKDQIAQISSAKNARVHSTLDERYGTYKTTYFFENEDYVFIVSVDGPSAKVSLLAEKLVNSFREIK